jgi:hypothetical protein
MKNLKDPFQVLNALHDFSLLTDKLLWGGAYEGRRVSDHEGKAS